MSCRFNHYDENSKSIDKPKSLPNAYLLSAWHEHVIMLIMSQRGVPFNPIVSRSTHGEFVGFVCKKFGYSPLYGSQDRDGKDKGGTAALFGLLRALKKGAPVAITVDGSIGPRRVVKQGIADLSRKTQTPIIPFGATSSRYWELNSWDRLKIPKPFSKINLVYAEEILIPKDTSIEEFPIYLEKIAGIMNNCEKTAIKLL